MAKKKQPVVSEFVDAFVTLPQDHRATIVAALRMYAQVMSTRVGSSTFSKENVERMYVFDEGATPLGPDKASYFADHLAKFVDVDEEAYRG
jgi:hypothetical protein